MPYKITPKFMLHLLCLATIIVFGLRDVTVHAASQFWQDSAVAANQGIKKLCGAGGQYRQESGAWCKNKDIARLAYVLCKDVQGFMASECGQKNKKHKIDLTQAKTKIIGYVRQAVADPTGKTYNNLREFICEMNVTFPKVAEIRGQACTPPARPARAAAPRRPAPAAPPPRRPTTAPAKPTPEWQQAAPTTERGSIQIGKQRAKQIVKISLGQIELARKALTPQKLDVQITRTSIVQSIKTITAKEPDAAPRLDAAAKGVADALTNLFATLETTSAESIPEESVKEIKKFEKDVSAAMSAKDLLREFGEVKAEALALKAKLAAAPAA